MIYVIATLTCKPDKHAPFLAGARAIIAATLKEPGCLFYDLAQSITRPDEFTFVERWTSREALEVHFHTADMAKWREVGKDCIADRKIEIVHDGRVESL